jgi:glycosyltransferase involved in cell wall biosynthesis
LKKHIGKGRDIYSFLSYLCGQNSEKVDTIIQYYNTAVETYGALGLGLMGAVLVLFGIQLYYYLGLFRRLPSFKIAGKEDAEGRDEGISVVLVMGDNYSYVEDTLPLLLGQDYGLYEIIVVYVGDSNDFAEALEGLAQLEPHFVTTRIKQTPLHPISNKMALNVGIKAARYDNIIITTSDARPVSARWLSLMAKGFKKSEIVLGYAGIENKRGIADKVIRSSRMFSSLLFITAAIRRKPYRGTIQNMGFSKRLYFDHKGFGHLNLNIGEEDLFMQQLFTRDNYTIVMHPRATVRQTRWGGLGWWFGECRLTNHAYPFYPRRAKSFIGWEAASRLLFFAAAVALIVMMPFEVQIAVGAVVLLRFVVVVWQMGRVARRLGEKGLVPLYFINDLLEPVWEIVVVVSRKVKPIREIWR